MIEDANDYREKFITYVNNGKLPKNKCIRDLIEELSNLRENDKKSLKRSLNSARSELFNPSPTSSPYLKYLEYVPDAFKKAFVVGCLVGTYNFAQEFSLTSAFKNGMYSGLTIFGASLVYDGSQNHIADQLKRLSIFEKELSNISLDDYSVKLKF
jgi:hypothetical protein